MPLPIFKQPVAKPSTLRRRAGVREHTLWLAASLSISGAIALPLLTVMPGVAVISPVTNTDEIETDPLRDVLAQGTSELPSRSCSAAFSDLDWSQLAWTDGDLGPNSFTVNGVTYTVAVNNPNNHAFTKDSPNIGDNNFEEPALFARPDMVGGGYIEFVVTIDRPITGVEGIVDDVDKRDFDDTWQDQVTITGFLGATAVTPFLSAFDPSNVVVTGNVAIGQTADNFPTGGGHGADVAFGFGDQPIDRFVVRYEPGPDIPMHTAAQHVTLNSWSFCSDPTEDYGDAPTSGLAPDGSGTNSYGNASHTIVSGVYLGAGEPDAEVSSQASANADGDDADGGDDDDGVTIPVLSQGQSATIDIDVAGSGGYLQGWIDWDGDGTFGAGEQIATDVQDDGTNGDTTAGDGTINLPVTVPAGAIAADTFARFRWSTTQGLNSTTAASDGEVEDYQVAIAAPNPLIGVAKTIASITDQEVTFDFVIENFGNVTLDNLILSDDLDTTFGAGNYTITSAPSIQTAPSQGSTVTPATNFNGASNTNLLDSTNSQLVPGETVTLRLAVEVTDTTVGGDGNGNYLNNASTSGDTPDDTTITDASTDSSDPDVDDFEDINTAQNDDGGIGVNDGDNDPTNNTYPTIVSFIDPNIGGGGFCQAPYNLVYSGQSNGIYAVHVESGAAKILTNGALATANGLSSNHDGHLVYYAAGNSIYAWDVINNQHISITNNFTSFLSSSPSGLSLSSGGAAFYDGSLYQGVDTGTFEIYKIDFVPGTNSRQIQSVTPLNIPVTGGDWGDFAITDDGVIIANGNGSEFFWSYDLNTDTFTDLTESLSANSQLAKDGQGRIWALGNNSTIAQLEIVGSTITEVPGTLRSTGNHTSFDAAECAVGLSSVGDFIWEDINGDGVQDPGENGIAGVTVDLYWDLDSDGQIDSNDPVISTQTTDANGNYDFTELIFGEYIVKVSDTDGVLADATLTSSSDTLAVVVPTGVQDLNDIDFGYRFAVPEASPAAGDIIINEVLYNGGGASAADNNEFIELYNASGAAVDLSGWQLADGNLVLNDTDGTGSITGNSSSPAYIFPASTTLAAGEYAVIWIGDNTADHQASDAAFQDWLAQAPKLNNDGDDIWLYDDQTRVVDYVAYGTNNAINAVPPAALNLWDDTYQSSLAGASSNQSISLTPNGQDGNTSACWEPTTSGDATSRCPGFLPTRNTGILTGGSTSVGANNNGSPTISLVKRMTAINSSTATVNGDPLDGYIDDSGDTSDNATNLWPSPIENYLIGGIDGGIVLPSDELEYSIYFLSSGDATARNVLMCDYVPVNTTFIANAFNSGPAPDDGTLTGTGLPGADAGIVLNIGGASVSLTNAADGDGGYYFPPGNDPAETFPGIDCDGDGDGANANLNGAVVVDVGDLPFAITPGTPSTSYGYFRFRGRVK